jgi:hypothetical protein
MRAEKVLFRCHAFESACADLDSEHRLTKPRHPWTKGQVERMNRTIEDATVKRFHDDSHDQRRQHLADFVVPTTSPAASRRYAASRLTKQSAKPGGTSPLDSLRTRTTKSRDETLPLANAIPVGSEPAPSWRSPPPFRRGLRPRRYGSAGSTARGCCQMSYI